MPTRRSLRLGPAEGWPTHGPGLALLEHELAESGFMKAGLSQRRHTRPSRASGARSGQISLLFSGSSARYQPKGLHDEYVSWVRPGASERMFKTPWSASRGLGHVGSTITISSHERGSRGTDSLEPDDAGAAVAKAGQVGSDLFS